MKIAVDCDVLAAIQVTNVIVTDIRGGNRVSQISCILDSTCYRVPVARFTRTLEHSIGFFQQICFSDQFRYLTPRTAI